MPISGGFRVTKVVDDILPTESVHVPRRPVSNGIELPSLPRSQDSPSPKLPSTPSPSTKALNGTGKPVLEEGITFDELIDSVKTVHNGSNGQAALPSAADSTSAVRRPFMVSPSRSSILLQNELPISRLRHQPSSLSEGEPISEANTSTTDHHHDMAQSVTHLHEFQPSSRKSSLQILRSLLPRSSSIAMSIVSYRSSVTGEASEQRPFVINMEADPNQDPFYLFQDDLEEGMKVGTFLTQQFSHKESNPPSSVLSDKQKAQKEAGKMGTMMGVFLPCIQNIFGILMFIRLPWVIGTAGALEGFFIVALSACTSILCAFSMSAIATNGVVPHGGSYFMISRSLGPELGGAVGFMFCIGQSIATGMYIIGAVEICVTYMVPQMMIVEKANCYRLYGTLFILILGTIVLVGMRLVNKFAVFFLGCVIVSVAAVIIGMLTNVAGNQDLKLCILGNRLLGKPYSSPCVKNQTSPLWPIFCKNNTWESCDAYFRNQSLREELAIPGMGNRETFYNNSFAHYASSHQYISENFEKVFASPETPLYTTTGYIICDVTESFTVLLSIFFPAVTGIMAGSNRSGDLKNAQKSIPVGTLAAVCFTTTIYSLLVFFYAGSVNSLLLRDKFGKSIGGGLIAAAVSWPHPLVVLTGTMMASIGAALQTMIGAPRLLVAIARDSVLDFLNMFSVVSPLGEPRRALLAVLVLAEVTVLIASIDYIAPILTQFTLICYLSINLACALQSLIRHPNWRPRFRFYHWTLSLTGAGLAITIMFISSWYYACIAIILASLIYKYIDFRGAEKEWGHGWDGLALSAARYSLLRLEGQVIHTKNWRPQLLVFCRMDEDMKPIHPELFGLANQLKAGRGLCVFASILEGQFVKCAKEVQVARNSLHQYMELENVKGFAEVLVANDAVTGMNHLIQTAGIGALKHNTVVIVWPKNWRQNTEYKHWRVFLDSLRTCHSAHHALLVPKNIHSFPHSEEKLHGTVDVWWIVHDGGLLMLLPFLLLKTKTWKHCKMRLFTIAQLEDNTIQIKKDLESFLYGLRINAEAHVVEMGSEDISAYTYERTLVMEQRQKMLKALKMTKRDSLKNNVQLIVDHSHPLTEKNLKPPATPRKKSSVQISNQKPTVAPPSVYVGAGDAVDESDDELLEERTDEEDIGDTGQVGATDMPASVPPRNSSLPAMKAGQSNSSINNIHSLPNVVLEENENDVQVESNEASGNTECRFSSRTRLNTETERSIGQRFGGSKPSDGNVRRMHTAVTMNKKIKEHSSQAQLVILNLPQPPKSYREQSEMNYMEFVEVLTDGLNRVLMVRGAGREVVTIYS